MLPATPSRAREEETKCTYAKDTSKNAEERHLQAKFLFKCSEPWQVLRDIKRILLAQSFGEKKEKDGTTVMKQCLAQEKDSLLFIRVFLLNY